MLTIGDLQSPSRRDFKKAAYANDSTYHYYYTRMRNIAMSLYRWHNLPDSCNARFLEKQLYYRGIAAFVPDPDLGWLSLPVIPNDTINLYEESLSYEAFSVNYSRQFDRDAIILIRNNLTSTPTDFVVRQFAWRLYNIERAIDTNISAQKTPVLIVCEDKQRLTMKQLYMQYDGNMPVIYGDKSLNPEALRVLRTDAPFIADKLSAQRSAVWAEFLTFIGIANVGFEKNERLTADEVNANNEFVEMSASVGFITRQQAAKELSKKISQNVYVSDQTTDIQTELLEIQAAIENGIEQTESGDEE